MIRLLGDLAAGLEREGYQPWVIAHDLLVYDATELQRDDGVYNRLREVILVEPCCLYLDRDGRFNLDGDPDLYLLPVTEEGTALLEQAHRVAELDGRGGELQQEYLTTLELLLEARRTGAGTRTLQQFRAMAAERELVFEAHATEEWEARRTLEAMIGGLTMGEKGRPCSREDGNCLACSDTDCDRYSQESADGSEVQGA